MQAATAGAEDGAPNHPLALRMGVIAGFSHNAVIGCIMGSFSVLLATAAATSGMTTEQALLGGPAVMLGSSLAAPIAGDAMTRMPLRRLMVFGAALATLGFVLLALVPGKLVYFASYLLLFGPAMAIVGSVGPATLVTRWFNSNRGLALGLVHLNIVVAVMPLFCNWLLGVAGPLAVYLTMAGLVALVLTPMLLAIRERPPEAVPAGDAAQPGAPAEALSLWQILKLPAFWYIAASASAVITGIMVLTFTMVPLAESYGYSRGQGAVLQTIMSVAGMAGSVLFGWLADRLGGLRGLALLAFDFAVLMAVLLLKLPFGVLAVVIGLLGLHGAGMVPNVSRALATVLGPAAFSRAFGLFSLLSVPFTALGIAGMGASHSATGSYNAGLAGVVALLLLAVPLTVLAGRARATAG